MIARPESRKHCRLPKCADYLSRSSLPGAATSSSRFRPRTCISPRKFAFPMAVLQQLLLAPPQHTLLSSTSSSSGSSLYLVHVLGFAAASRRAALSPSLALLSNLPHRGTGKTHRRGLFEIPLFGSLAAPRTPTNGGTLVN